MAEPVNLLALRPARRARWDRGPDGRVTLRVPKFRRGLAARWLAPLLARPDVAVRLDAEGSFVWDRCDGGTTVLAIAEEMRRELGGDADAVVDRVGRFVERLARAEFVTMDLPGDQR